jgi:hypothetical protein
MPDAEFEAKWGNWCRQQDRDLNRMRRRWITDLEAALPHAEREDAAVAELVAAKDAYRRNPSEANRARKAAAVAAVQALRADERSGRTGPRVAGDAFIGRL